MDENLVVYAIQWKKQTDFPGRYRTYPSQEARDADWKLITFGQPQETIDATVAPVEMHIRVETQSINESE